MKRRTKILLEITQLLVIRRRSGDSALSWCATCAKNVHMISTDNAAIIARQSTRTIYRWVEAGRLHFTEQPEGQLLICLDSLPLR
ncbi:MAG: hypothetical protein WCF57_01440 [Pyrinomonadaceae bacterium]